MEKLDKVIAGLTGCLVGNCSNCEYGGDGCHRDQMMKDALRILKMWDVIHKDIWDRTHEIVRLKKELKAVRAELDAAREKLSWLEPRTAPNDWGEYPPEFPREGM